MDDFYTEQLIKKQADSKDTLKKVGLIALTVVSVLWFLLYRWELYYQL